MQSVKDKTSRTLLTSTDAATWLSKDVAVSLGCDHQTIGTSDQPMTLKAEPRLKYGRWRGRRRLKTSVGAYRSRLTSRRNPLRGELGAQGIRLEQRIRVNPSLKLVACGAALGTLGKSRRETGRTKALEAVFRPRNKSDGREFLVGWNSTTTKGRGPNGRVTGEQTATGGTLAASMNLTNKVSVSTRVTLSPQGQHTFTTRLLTTDEGRYRFGILIPVIAWVVEKLGRRGSEL